MDDEPQAPRRRRAGRLSPQGVVVVVEAVVAGIAGVFLTTDFSLAEVTAIWTAWSHGQRQLEHDLPDLPQHTAGYDYVAAVLAADHEQPASPGRAPRRARSPAGRRNAMTRERYDHRDTYATRERLSTRYAIDLATADPLTRLSGAVTAHAHYAEHGGDEYTEMTPAGEIHDRTLRRISPKPTTRDLLDGLTLVDEGRHQADRRERHLIDAAVAAGVGWQQIGVALGHTAETAAKARRAQLARQIKQYENR